jgi:hypothetical protein
LVYNPQDAQIRIVLCLFLTRKTIVVLDCGDFASALASCSSNTRNSLDSCPYHLVVIQTFETNPSNSLEYESIDLEEDPNRRTENVSCLSLNISFHKFAECLVGDNFTDFSLT